MCHIMVLTDEQFDLLEEATDLMAMGMKFADTMADAIAMLSKDYIQEHSEEFEAEWEPLPEDELDPPPAAA